MADTPSNGTARGTPEVPTTSRLDSWKQIAAYLNRDVATVRRWEKREALPAHRHLHEKVGSVYAFTGELDAWMASRRPMAPPRSKPLWRRVPRRSMVFAGVALALAAAAVTAWLATRGGDRPDAPIRAIAVLPFQSIGTGARDEALELGMADALIARLSGLRQIQVRPSSAVFEYGNARAELMAIGRRLRVDALVQGTVQRDGDRIRVSVRLVRVHDEAPLWSRTLEEPFTSIFAVQDAIADQIAHALPLALTTGEARRLARRDTEDLAAYQHYLIGRRFRSQVTEDGLRKAVDRFREAIKLDPGYALAHAALADAFTLWSNFTIIPSREAYLNAKAAALEALRLDDTLADAHTTLAMVNLFYDWDWPSAERALKRALMLEPNDARAHQRYGLGLMWLGRFDQAIKEIERAQELNPVELEIQGNLSLVLYFARRYDAAILEARRTLDMDPHSYQAHRTIARASLEKGKRPEAIAAFHQAIASGGIRTLQAELGHAYAVDGQTAKARRILGELTTLAGGRAASPFDLAILRIGLGDTTEALSWLTRSFAERERWMVTLHVAPVFDPLRADPRFVDLVHRIGLWPDDVDRPQGAVTASRRN